MPVTRLPVSRQRCTALAWEKPSRCPESICSLNSRYERNIGEYSQIQAEPTDGSHLTGGFHSLGLHREAWSGSALAHPHRQNTQKTPIKLDADASNSDFTAPARSGSRTVQARARVI